CDPSDLVQTIDLSMILEPEEMIKTKGLPGYFTYGWKKATKEIIKAANLGIKKVSLRFIDSTEKFDKDIHLALNRFEAVLTKVQEFIEPHNIQLIIDPFGLALNKKGQWRVENKDGNLDTEATLELLTEIGRRVSR